VTLTLSIANTRIRLAECWMSQRVDKDEAAKDKVRFNLHISVGVKKDVALA
jgi:hypothetical protein